MTKNVGTADRVLRALVAAPALIVGGVLAGPGGVLAIVLYVLAAVMLATAAAGFCPLYALLGVKTCPLQKAAAVPAKTPVTR